MITFSSKNGIKTDSNSKVIISIAIAAVTWSPTITVVSLRCLMLPQGIYVTLCDVMWCHHSHVTTEIFQNVHLAATKIKWWQIQNNNKGNESSAINLIHFHLM